MQFYNFVKKRGGFVLLVVTILAFWQVAFMQNSMKWDFTDAYLPSRYFFSEAVLNNIFPFWNPYQFFGVPVYADLTSVFNPEYWIVANMFGYSNITLQLVFLAYVFIAGVSFRFFLKQFKAEPLLAIGLSVAYMLSGFTVGNSQHLSFVIGYAILPLVLGIYLQFLRKQDGRNMVALAITCILTIYAGYPGITIILAYYMFGIFVFHAVYSLKNKGNFRTLLFSHLLLAGIVFIACSVFFLSFMQARPFLSRYGGIALEKALCHPFSLKSILSFIFPMATGCSPGFFNTDVSMSNGYFGIFSLVLFLLVLTIKPKEKLSYLLLAMGGFFFVAALGEHFFVRKFLYDYIPLFNMFKYPAIFRSITIFSILAFVGINFRTGQFWGNNSKRLVYICGSMVALVAFVIVLSFFENDLKAMNKAILKQGIIQIILLSGFMFLLIRKKELKPVVIMLFFIADGIVSVQLNSKYTVISDTDPIQFEKYLNSEPKGFPIQGHMPVAEYSDRNAQNQFVWINNNVFPKRISYDGKVSFILDGYKLLIDKYPELLDAILQNPVLYFSDDIRPNSFIHDFGKETVFIDSIDYQNLNTSGFKGSNSDEIRMTRFSPSEIKVLAETQYGELLVLQQNYYAGWKVFVDGKKKKLLTVNFTHMAVEVPPGSHLVEFRYSNPAVVVFFVFYMAVLLLLLALWLYFGIKENPGSKKKVLTWVVAGFALFVMASVVNRFVYSKHKQGILPEILSCIEQQKREFGKDATTFLSLASETDSILANVDYQYYLDHKNNIAEIAYALSNSQSQKFVLGWANGAICNEAKELLYSFYPETEQYKETSNSGLIVAQKGETKDYDIYQDFEPGTTSIWETEIARTGKDTLENNSFYVFHPEQKWGKGLELPVDDKMLSLKRVTILADIKIVSDIDEILMVFEIKRKDKSLTYSVSKINRFVKYPQKWTRMAMVNHIAVDMIEGDVIRVFFWNKNKVDFQIDNIRISLDR